MLPHALIWKRRVRAYIGDHLGYLAVVSLLFGMGVIFGALTINNLPGTDRQNLLQYLRFFLRDFGGSMPVRGTVLAQDAIWTNLKTLAFLFLLSISAIGTPFILLAVFTRGYVLGFTIGFLVKQLALKGFLFAMVAVVPHNLIMIPALLAASTANLDLGLSLIMSRFSRRTIAISHEILQCLGITGLAMIVLLAAGLIEGYVSPVLMGWMAKYLS